MFFPTVLLTCIDLDGFLIRLLWAQPCFPVCTEYKITEPLNAARDVLNSQKDETAEMWRRGLYPPPNLFQGYSMSLPSFPHQRN